MAQDFFDLLYNGYTGEYQLMSSLYRNGLDALRPPADMGVDVVSLNLKQRLEQPDVPAEMFYFQVKTAVTNVSENADRPGAFAVVEFKLKATEVNLLSCSGDRALFCYVYNSEAGALTDAFETPFICFWLDGCLLAKLERQGAFYCKEGESKLKGNGKSVPALSVLKTPLRDGEPLGGKTSAESDFATDDDDDFLD